MKRAALLALLCLSACAMQRATEAETAQRQMLGLDKEQVFTCMGIPKKKATEGATEIWSYDSGDKFSVKSKKKVSSSKEFGDAITATLGLDDEVRTSRFCKVNIVMREGRVSAVNYSGPTGGFLTEDEQCAYAVRNCLESKNPTP